jgi:hypothetical protein
VLSSLEEYKSFIDDLVSVSHSVVADWVVDNGFPDTKENQIKNEFVKSLSPYQKEVLSTLILEAKESGVHDTLAYLSEQQCNNNLKIIKGNHQLPIEPFGTEMNYDFVARIEEDEWPSL